MSDATATGDQPYEGWAVIELMGHRKTAGMVSQVSQYGVAMIRIDTPGPDGKVVASQCYGGAAIYCLTPCTEATARRIIEDEYTLPPMVRIALQEHERRTNPELPLLTADGRGAAGSDDDLVDAEFDAGEEEAGHG